MWKWGLLSGWFTLPWNKQKNPTELLAFLVTAVMPFPPCAPTKRLTAGLWRGADFTTYWVDSSQHPWVKNPPLIKAEQRPGQLKCSFLYNRIAVLIFLEVNILEGALGKWAESWCWVLAAAKRSSGNGCSSRTATKSWTHPDLLQLLLC